MPSWVLKFQTPLDCFRESYPDNRLIPDVPLRVFRCVVFVHTHGPNRTKFTPRAQKCVFAGYPLHQCGYKCYHPSSRKYFVSMDVIFFEDHPFFPLSPLQGESTSEETHRGPSLSILPELNPKISVNEPILPTEQIPWIMYYRRNLRKEIPPHVTFLTPVHESERVSVPDTSTHIPDNGNINANNDACVESDVSKDRKDSDSTKDCTENVIDTSGGNCEEPVPTENVVDLGEDPLEDKTYEQNAKFSRGKKEKKDHNASLDLPITLRKGTRSCTKYPLQSYLSYNNLSPVFKALTTSLGTITIPSKCSNGDSRMESCSHGRNGGT
ncbi:uncharacterized protein LOC120072531 [Benincasa hispida]|uniref:uncharacterized protein LOC120072531 n=1 Tax=Benincasa hispida TaxID=102211 RepID=UPI001901C314|nr:uncharacterized protein LOC120072531 [Benincasa hispida]